MENLLIHTESKDGMLKIEKLLDEAGYTVNDSYNLTLELDEENSIDALETELTKLFIENNIEEYTFEAGSIR